jgi:tRNA-binding EMAP/Myf-like protein
MIKCFILPCLSPLGFDSNGMVVCASNGDHSKVEILRPPAGKINSFSFFHIPTHYSRISLVISISDSKVGERIFLEGKEALYP